ncbi:MAG: tetratricopeptide repeat protein [Candidatus Thorarchaeota archaeon]
MSIEQLVEGEKYEEALKKIEDLQSKVPDRNDWLRMEVLKSRCLSSLGETRKAIRVAESVVKEGMKLQEDREIVIDALVEKTGLLIQLFQVDKAFETCEQAEKLRQELPTDDESLLESIRASILYVKSICFYYKDDIHKGIECALESLSIREQLRDMPRVVDSLMQVGHLQFHVDGIQMLEYMEKALQLSKELGRKGPELGALLYTGMKQSEMGNWTEAEELLTRGINLARKHDRPIDIPKFLFGFALLYQNMGDYQRAEEYYLECFTISEKRDTRLLVAMCSNNLGEIHKAQGRLDEALAGFEVSMKINKEMGRLTAYVWGLGNCGMIQYARGNLDEALTLLEGALTSSKERREAGLLSSYLEWGTLFIVQVLIDKGMVEEAQQHVEDLRQIMQGEGDVLDNQIYQTSAAIVLESSGVARDKALAKEYLTEVVEGELRFHEITVLAYLLLCDLLVEDLKLSGDRGLLDELKWRLTSLMDTAIEQGSTSLQTEALILQSKVTLLEFDTEKSEQLLTQAHVLAKQRGLDRLVGRVESEHRMLLDELSLWEELEDEKPALIEMTDRLRINEQIRQMRQQGVWRKMLF